MAIRAAMALPQHAYQLLAVRRCAEGADSTAVWSMQPMHSSILRSSSYMTGRMTSGVIGMLKAVSVVLVLYPAAASAENCVDQVRRLADAYRVSSDPPTVPPGEVKPDELGRSQGVIEPPPTSDKPVMSPPRDTRYGMPTVPDIAPAPPRRESQDSRSLSPSQLTTLQSILVAARAQAERGKEADCLERLHEAQQFIQRTYEP